MTAEVGPAPAEGFVPYCPERYSVEETAARARAFYQEINGRRTVRHFSSEPVSREAIEHILLAAGTAPSGAHKQPWHFVAVTDPDVKRRLRAAAEVEEKENYERRFPSAWKDDLAPLGTDWHKPFLEIAPFV
jgi:iodotyrosine deiodinase